MTTQMKRQIRFDALQSTAKRLHVDDTVDWATHTFHSISFGELPRDYRSKEGRELHKKCKHIADVKALKRLTKQLIAFDIDFPPATAIAYHQATIPTSIPTVPLRCASDGSTDLQASQGRIHTFVASWWRRRTIATKGVGYYTEHLWKNEVDPVSLDSLRTLPKAYLFTHVDATGHVYAFDVRTLCRLLDNKMVTNPFNKEPFGAKTIARVRRRIATLQRLDYSLLMDGEILKVPPKKLTAAQIHDLILDVSQALDLMGYHVTVELMDALTPQQLINWYMRCEDIWNFRAELSDSSKARIVPDGRVFEHKSTLKSFAKRKLTLQKHVYEAMRKLVSTGITEADKCTGGIYVISALTECSDVVRETYPGLYQPP
jgi:hypothetical protein